MGKGSNRNRPCSCGSGKKSKKCCNDNMIKDDGVYIDVGWILHSRCIAEKKLFNTDYNFNLFINDYLKNNYITTIDKQKQIYLSKISLGISPNSVITASALLVTISPS